MTPSQNELHDLKDDFRALLDQVRVKVHLGGMEARRKFEEIRHEAAKMGFEAGRTSRRVAEELLTRLRKLADSLDGND